MHIHPLIRLPIFLAFGLIAACGGQERASEENRQPAPPASSDVKIVEALGDPGSWALHGRTYGEDRFSPLERIDRGNVADLELAWSYDFDTRRGQESTPIIIDGVMYVSSAWSKVHALDAKTGELIWQYDPEVPGEWAVRGCCDIVNRGVAYWNGKIYVGSFDGRLIAIDAASGERAWETDTIIDRDEAYTITGAPRIVKGRVIIGNGGGEFGVRGYVSAYDAETGALDWRFFTVPGDPSKPFENPILEMAAKTWSGEWWKHGGGGTVWDSMAYDAELDLLYIGVGNGSPWNPAIRSPGGGDNLFISSIVALRPETGEYVWHYQTTPGDQWDYTATQHMILADLDIGGEPRKAIMQAPKNGFFYVLDRTDGTLISAEAFAPMNWADGVDIETGRPNILEGALYHENGDSPFMGTPGPMGAHNWHPMSFSKATGLVYLPAQFVAFPYAPETDYRKSKLSTNLGIDLEPIILPTEQTIRDQVRRSLKGRLMAWDPVAQKEVWRVDHGGPWNGGVLSTAGGLVFQGNRNGGFAAYDDRTGEKLWERDAQTGVIAAPVSYEIDAEQYIAVAAGWGGVLPLLLGELSHLESGAQVNRSRVLVYRLGGDAPPLDRYPVARAPSPAPAPFGTDEQIADGRLSYTRYCSGCHGDTAVSGGVLPDLRSSYALADEETWNRIVLEGALTPAGMVGFADELSPRDAANIRAYIVRRAHEAAASAQDD
ncbi:PQQ-dependent dehydrogenase, methanol/ethanol family [Hyphococcus sp.]|uniref:PQQ-dependent dehydrogenase, methanol/ethanol family n=1 Tax=Hyphococcus sp. TaxID=2038636 RepID=UPI003CCB9924